MTTEAEIEALTVEWWKDCGGRNVIVPIGAALNVITTCGLQAPPEVRASIVQFLHVVANKLDERMQ